ncbi:unnamed protein product [Polarella glacialis]|uniref:Ion transport domain-containing protein n=1 Tax=Polarella glacialis TaxID=89957 RepID=A0A813I6B6_POLGL|nr:unnamed protein product [Polarella glacialis]CAE8645360.1 unnamed protein product [Polarella glacialis]
METGKVLADNNNNNSPMEQQAGEQGAVSKERGEQDKKIDEMMLEIDINMELERQESKEKGHDGQTGKVPADASPVEQQAEEPGSISKERGEQDKKVDEMELKTDINIKPSDSSGSSTWICPPRPDLSFGFIGVVPAGPGSHQRESPYFALPGDIVKPPNVPLIKGEFSENLEVQIKMVSKNASMSMLEPVVEAYKKVAPPPRRRSSEGCISPLVGLLELRIPAPSASLQSRSSKSSNLEAQSPKSNCSGRSGRFVPSALSSSAYLARATSRQDVASDGDTFDMQLMGLHPVWKNQAHILGTQQLRWAQSTGRTGTIVDDRSSEEQDHQLYAYLWGRQAWEVLGLLMICVDLVAVPMQVFEPYPIELILITTILTTLYWTCDVPFSFVASQHSDGARHISWKAMARQYASSWLLFDSIMVLVNWLAVVLTIFVAAERNDQALSHIGSPKLLRLVSWFRVLRVPRFIFKSKAGFLVLLEEYGGSKRVRIISGIAGMLVFIVLTNHLIACAFYGIATIPGLDDNWAYYAFELTGRTSWLYRYTTSYHWAMGLFHTSGSDIIPTNSAERIFVQFVLIWNLAVFSTLIASIGNALQQLRELNEERTEQFAKVRRYFSSNNVKSGLAKKAWAALSLAAQKPKRRTNWDEIKILQRLPKSLQAELHRHIREPILSVHPFFSAFDVAFTVQMQQVYQLCIS